MKRTLITTMFLIATATLALGQTKSMNSASMNTSEKEALIALEKQAWDAWKTRDGKVFQGFLSEEYIGVGDSGVTKKATTVKDIASSDCEVRSYSLDSYEVVMLDPNTAILTYKADQDATCKGKAVPAKVWASSVYIKRGGKWLNAFHQETPATSQ
jgi:hypothetical protein